MSGPLRSARPCVVALLTTALVLGVNGFVGAIHSVHHLPAPVEAHVDDAHDHDPSQPEPAPGASDPSCPVAAAALHLAATEAPALPALAPAPAEAGPAAHRPQDAPRAAWRQPDTGRAPPTLHSPAG